MKIYANGMIKLDEPKKISVKIYEEIPDYVGVLGVSSLKPGEHYQIDNGRFYKVSVV